MASNSHPSVGEPVLLSSGIWGHFAGMQDGQFLVEVPFEGIRRLQDLQDIGAAVERADARIEGATKCRVAEREAAEKAERRNIVAKALRAAIDYEDLHALSNAISEADAAGCVLSSGERWKVVAIKGLLDAETSGNLAIMNCACTVASDSGVSKSLVRHAKAAFAARMVLIDALDGRNPEDLRKALGQATAASTCQELIEQAQKILSAEAALQKAMSGEDAARLKAACDDAASVGLPSTLVRQGREVMVAMSSLLSAMQSQDLQTLVNACEQAEGHGVSQVLVTRALRLVAQSQRRSVANTALLEEMNGEDDIALTKACDEAVSAGGDPSLVAQARANLHAMIKLKKAMLGEDVAALFSACEAGASAGISQTLLRRAERLRVRWLADAALTEAMRGVSADVIDRAAVDAEAKGVEMATVTIARERADLLRKGSALSPSEGAQALLFVGRTENHKKLARLLGKALEQHDLAGALAQLMNKVRHQGSVFDPEHSRAYRSGGHADYGARGGRPYFKPVGWLRYAIHVDDFQNYKNWCVAYHGTTNDKIMPILLRGLRKPGEEGVSISHGQHYSETRQTIYLSPSVEYAAFPVYVQLFALGEDHWAQLVFQCRVRPGAFVERPGTLGNKHWPRHLQFDPNFKSTDCLEWLVESPEDIVVYGLMVREFGPHADAALHGYTATSVQKGVRGPEFEWTRLRAEEFERRGLNCAVTA